MAVMGKLGTSQLSTGSSGCGKGRPPMGLISEAKRGGGNSAMSDHPTAIITSPLVA